MPNQQQLLQTNESRLTTAIIGVLLIIGGFMIYSFVRGGTTEITTESTPEITEESADTETEVTEEVSTKTPEEINETLGAYTYTVQPGDCLWKIAEQKLGDGFAWKELAQVNNISVENPVITTGQELIVSGFGGPANDGDVLSALTAELTEDGDTVSVETYTVGKGDTLWSIAEKLYGDGEEWHKIFDAPENNLSMHTVSSGQTYPLIHNGNVLVIP